MIEVNRHRLANGLRIVHSQAKGARMVAVDVLYGVGSRDEVPGKTGLAHLLEHLMFNGSAGVRDFSACVQDAAGECNAWTNCDVTNYYMSLPPCNVETAFWLESDRMVSLNLDLQSVTTQRDVVTEEFKQRVYNAPYGDIGHLLRGLCYTRHPYRWPTVGSCIDDVASLGVDDVKAFYSAYYNPCNAVLSVVGDISMDSVIGLADKWFGGIAGVTVPVRTYDTEPAQESRRLLQVERGVPVDTIYMAFPMVERMHGDFYVYDIISDILSNGKSSRVVNNLVRRDKVFSTIDAYIDGSMDAGLFHVDGKLSPGVTFEQAEEKIRGEIAALAGRPVMGHELEKVKNKYESNFMFSNLNNLNLAYSLAYYELLGDARGINSEVEKYKSVTAADISRVLSGHFTDSNSSVVYYKAV